MHGWDLDATTISELQEAMQGGRLTSVALTQAYLHRIRALDDDLGAVPAVNRHAVRDTAAPPTTAGSRALRGSRPDDATITRRLRAAGAIVLGKASLSEWANFRGANATSGWSGVGGSPDVTVRPASPARRPPEYLPTVGS